MKKLLLTIIAVVSVVVMGFAMAACSSDVAGNTYVFDTISVTYDSTVPDEDKMSDEDLAEWKEDCVGAYVTFEKDGTCKFGHVDEEDVDISYYKQDGDKIYIYETKEEADAGNKEDAWELKVNGNKIEQVITYEGQTTKYVYKKK